MSDFTTYAPIVMANLIYDLSLKDFQAAGIVGNFGHESDLIPGIHEIGASHVAGGIGWGQWTGSRHTSFVAYCTAHGLSTTSEKANYNYALEELRGSYAHVITGLRQTTTLDEAVILFEREYELAGIVSMGDRLAFANLALTLYRKSVGVA